MNFTQNYKADMHAFIDALFTQDKTQGLTREQRIEASDALIEAYVGHTQQRPDSVHLERLGTLILREELTDSNPYKVSHEAEPILNERQEERRFQRERRSGVVEYGDRPTTGFRKGYHTDKDDSPQFTRTRLF